MCARAWTRPVRRPRTKRWRVARASTCAVQAGRAQGIYLDSPKHIRHVKMRRTWASSREKCAYGFVDLAETNSSSPGSPMDSPDVLCHLLHKIDTQLQQHIPGICSLHTPSRVTPYRDGGVVLACATHTQYVVERTREKDGLVVLYAFCVHRHCVQDSDHNGHSSAAARNHSCAAIERELQGGRATLSARASSSSSAPAPRPRMATPLHTGSFL